MDKKDFLIVAVITLIAAALRFYQLTFNSLWTDEAWTMYLINQPFFAIPRIDVHPPLFYWLEVGVVKIISTSEFSLRLLPAIFGTMTVPAVYYLGKTVMNWKAGLIASILVMISPVMIHHSQDARCYSLAILLFIVTLTLYVQEKKNWYLIAICAAALLWTNYPMVIPLGIIVLHALYTNRKSLNDLALSGILFIALTFLLGLFAVQALTLKLGSGETFGQKGAALVMSIPGLISSDMAIFCLCMILVLAGTITLWKADRSRAWLMLALMTVPLAAGLVAAEFIPMVSRYFLFLIPLASVLIGCLFGSKRGESLVCFLLVFVLIVGMQGYSLSEYYGQHTQPDWSQFNSKLSALTEDNSNITVLANLPWWKQFNYYYNATADRTHVIRPMSLKEFKEQRDPGIIVIPKIQNEKEADQGTLEYLRQNATLIAEIPNAKAYRLA